jgi:outer membrane immunogenic protein
MKRIVLATALVALGSASALAADLPPRSYDKAPAMAPVSNWSGLYIGGNVGYGWGNNSTDFAFLPTPVLFGVNNATLDNKSSSIVGGAQIGYNWQIGSLVSGLEADVQRAGLKGEAGPVTATISSNGVTNGQPFVPSALTTSHELSWFGTVRGRLGVTITPDLLIYATGGLAYGGIKAAGAANFPGDGGLFAVTTNTTKAGWTAGAGAEWMFARNWSARLEYLHVDLGNVSAATFGTQNIPPFATKATWHNQYDIVRAGVNYHFN